ncbi:MAG: DUF4860 domain-containing protein [Oscillospiraceae bacterium]|nr:DUF4860 domain-containing protein [Oscillospiraceae bacterium]
MKSNKKERKLSTIAALLLFAVFATGVFAVLLTGAKVYRTLVQRDETVYDSRTCSQYLLSKLRQAPNPDSVSISDFGQSNALVITQVIEGDAYVTRIYCHNGWLMELFSVAEGAFSPEDGEKILPASDLKVTQQGDLLKIAITDGNGEKLQLQYTLRGWEEVP